MVFESTYRFRDDLIALTAKRRDGYSSVKNDLIKRFSNCPFPVVYALPCIRQIGSSRLIKCRIANSGAGIGTSGAFRLILIAIPKEERVILCHLYPKRGRLGKATIAAKEVAEILHEVADQIENNSLLQVDFLIPPQTDNLVGEPQVAAKAYRSL